jgi:acyl-homoserine lactone acylase PvdQ
VIIGHNARIAWGVTNLGFDVQDLYAEKIDQQTGRYLFRGQVEQARSESEWIRVKNARPVEFRQWVTRHGPVAFSENGRYFALRWAAAEPDGFAFPFLDINRAGNWREFTAALARYPGPRPKLRLRRRGRKHRLSGYRPASHSQKLRRRRAGRRQFGRFRMGRLHSVRAVAGFYNPPRGWIVTANQNPFPENYPYRVHGYFASPYRSLEIRTPAPMVMALAYQQLRKRIVDSASPGKSDLYGSQMAPAVVEKILSDGGRGWFQDQDELLMRSLAAGIADGRHEQGSNVKRWDYGKYNQLTIKHPVGSQLPLIGGYFNIGPVEMSGSTTTIKQTTLVLGPSMRFIADLSNWDGSLNNLTVGESGQILSPHYKDQWDAYYSGRSFPMQFERVDAKSTLEIRPQ